MGLRVVPVQSFENPVLQKHWRNIEALALDRDAPEEMTDYTCKLGQINHWGRAWRGVGWALQLEILAYKLVLFNISRSPNYTYDNCEVEVLHTNFY